VYKIYVENVTGKTPLGRCKIVWEDCGEKYTVEITCNSVEWIHEVPYRIQWGAILSTVVNLRIT
jgi:hypothetical protein